MPPKGTNNPTCLHPGQAREFGCLNAWDDYECINQPTQNPNVLFKQIPIAVEFYLIAPSGKVRLCHRVLQEELKGDRRKKKKKKKERKKERSKVTPEDRKKTWRGHPAEDLAITYDDEAMGKWK